MRDAAESRIACLASDDGGATWYDYAVSEVVGTPYSIGGCRELAADGSIIGSFTEQLAPTTDPGGGSKVHFFRIQGGLAAARIRAIERRDDGFRLEFDAVRGRPVEIRFRAGGGSWGRWRAFENPLTVPGPDRPSAFRLRGRLGVESGPFDVPPGR
jgi:hypothetical protein